MTDHRGTEEPAGTCDHLTGCKARYKTHHWGKKEAAREGWFFQKNGDAFCPKHVPEWVEEWRARQQAKKESNDAEAQA